ncbi:MAG: cytochrome P460 family protein [Steroidobacter sp.]
MSNQSAIALALVLLACTAGVVMSSDLPTSNAVAAYPEGFREWTHVKSALVGPQSPAYPRYGGLHGVYANALAVNGYRSGRFEDGAIIVFDLFDTVEQAGTTAPGARKFIDVMVRDSKRFAATGGWGFEEFSGNSRSEGRLSHEQQTACFGCHQQLAASDLVISEFAD